MSDLDLARLAEAIDHLVTAPISNWTILKGLPLDRLHAAACAKVGGSTTHAATRLLLERVQPGDRVLMLTGFIMRGYGRPETDGPIGAAVLARALSLTRDAIPVGVCEPDAVAAVEACLATAGLVPATLADLGSGRHRCAVAPFPIDAAEAEARAEALLDELNPTALIAVERPGAGADGLYHGGGGFDISHFTAKTDILFAKAQARGIATIGIGDLGNELGLGVVADEVRRSIPDGETIAAVAAADVAVVANISNWGAYGIAACLAIAAGQEDAFHTAKDEHRLIEACVRAGAIDPVGGQLRAYVDGTDADTNAAMVELLRSLVRLGNREMGHVERYRASWSGAGKPA